MPIDCTCEWCGGKQRLGTLQWSLDKKRWLCTSCYALDQRGNLEEVKGAGLLTETAYESGIAKMSHQEAIGIIKEQRAAHICMRCYTQFGSDSIHKCQGPPDGNPAQPCGLWAQLIVCCECIWRFGPDATHKCAGTADHWIKCSRWTI